MPKLTHRCNRRGRFGGPPAASVAFMAPPRKVSFEDNPHDSDSNSDPGSPDSIKSVELLTVLTEEAAPRLSRKPTLVRPKSSLSLVDLAGNDDNSTHHAAQTCLSAPVSPIMHPQEVDISSSPQMPGSPWGHFVDMVIAYEEPRPAPHHYHNSPCNSCSSCRRRRANPYGEYKTKSKSRPLCFVQDPSCEKSTMLQHFRLSPRHEPTDQLIGALHRLQVD
jgi:hypothetical protein